jgi:hypothetical protein
VREGRWDGGGGGTIFARVRWHDIKCLRVSPTLPVSSGALNDVADERRGVQ